MKRKVAAKKSPTTTPGLYSRLTERIIKGEVLVVVGPGVSLAATRGNPVATWQGLLENGSQRCAQLFSEIGGGWMERLWAQIHSEDIADLFEAAARIAHQLQDEYYRWLRETVGALRIEDASVMDALRYLGLPLATTNHDDLLEQGTGLPRMAVQSWQEAEQAILGRKPGIVHLFGCWNDPEPVRPGERYEMLLGSRHSQALKKALRMRSLLLVGYGDAADPIYRAVLDESFTGGIASRRFQLCLESEMSSVSDVGLIPIPYGNRPSHLAPFLRKLRPPVQSAPEPSDPVPGELDPLLLAFLLVLVGRAKPQLLTQLDLPSIFQAMHGMNIRAINNYDALLEAQRALQEEFPDARPNPLWVAWMRATRGGELQQIAAATAP